MTLRAENNSLNDEEPTGTWSVWQRDEAGSPVLIEGELPEEIARDMVADYRAEGIDAWAEDSATR